MKSNYIRLGSILNILRSKTSLCIGILFILCIIVLYNIPKLTEFDLDINTEKISFSLFEDTKNVSFFQGIPLQAIALYGVSPISMQVKSLKMDKTIIEPREGSINIVSVLGEEAQVSFKNKDFRLMRLGLEGKSEVKIYSDNQKNIFIEIISSKSSNIEIGIPDGEFNLVTRNAEITDNKGKKIVPNSSESNQQSFIVRTLYRYLIFEQEGRKPFGLVLTFKKERISKTNLPISLAVATSQRITELDFNHKVNNRKISAINSLLISTSSGIKSIPRKTFLRTNKDDEFTLNGIFLNEKGLSCQVTGRVSSLKVGKERADQNLAPSLLEFLVNHVIIKTILQGWKGA